jgi:hypothetical protein
VELGQPEERDDGVADELLDLAPVALEDLPCDLRVALEDPVHRLRIEELAEGRRVDHVGEDDGRRPPAAYRFAWRRPSDRRGRGRGRGLARRSGGLELRVVAEHAALELAQLGARLQPELLVEERARLAVDLERLRLAAGGVEAAHQLGAQPLAEGVLGHQRAQLGHDLALAAAAEIGLEAVFEHL